MSEMIPLLLFLCICFVLMLGYPVAFTLSGVSLIFAAIGIVSGHFDPQLLKAFPDRLFGIVNNSTLIAVPLFVFMGVTLERSKIAESLLKNLTLAFGGKAGGMGFAVIAVGALLAASTGIVGATVVTMGLMALPVMMKQGYQSSLSTGIICATGTLGQIVPPSIALVLLGDILSTANQQAQLAQGNFQGSSISVGDLFVAAVIPSLLLIAAYLCYVAWTAWRNPMAVPALSDGNNPYRQLGHATSYRIVLSLLPPIALMVIVLGSIIFGLATPTEAAAVGAMGACVLAKLRSKLDLSSLYQISESTLKITCMVFAILIGASLFSLIFRGFGGEELIARGFGLLPDGTFWSIFIVMLVIFFLGFILDFIEITFVIVPLIAPPLFMMGIDPVWLGIMIAINLQTSFLTPPFGFALFYLRGVAPSDIPTSSIYQGVLPFILLQVLLMIVLSIWPTLATWLPSVH